MKRLIPVLVILAVATLAAQQSGTTYGTRFRFDTTLCTASTGSGAPSGGADCDLYLKSDGTLYIRTGGNWVAMNGATEPILLQGSTPGAAQTGHLAISGTGLFGTSLGVGVAATHDRLLLSPVAKGTNQYDGTLTSADLTAARTWTLPNASGVLSLSQYGEIYQYENSTAVVIGVQNEYYALTILSLGLADGFTAETGQIGSITSVADAGGGDITVSAAGTWVAGQIVTIHATTDYDGAYAIKTGGSGTFVVTDTYTQTRTGSARRPATLLASAGSAGVYRAAWSASATTAANTITFRIEPNVNVTPADNCAGKAQTSANSTTRTLAGSGYMTIADGDRIWLSLKNTTSATNITVEFCNLNLTRVR